MARPGPVKRPFHTLSPAGKSQRKDPTAHRKYNNEQGKKKSEREDRSEHNKERRRRGMGKAGLHGKVLTRQPDGSLKPGDRIKNSDTSKIKKKKWGSIG